MVNYSKAPTAEIVELLVKRFRESGGADLDFGAIVDGEFLKRSGWSIVSAVPAGGGITKESHIPLVQLAVAQAI